MRVLVTGGAGYIGSHAVLALLEHGYNVVVVDNLCNSSVESIRRVELIAGKKVELVMSDVREYSEIREVFNRWEFDCVLHFAGLKSVNESIKEPQLYYENNVSGTLNVCRCMEEAGVHKLVFSSSATVYGVPENNPVDEDHPVGRSHIPYGKSKSMVEEVLRDIAFSSNKWSIALLRYFNPVGAHQSGLIGEDPSSTPTNLMPYITQVAVKKLKKLSIYGDDYSTADGTGVRDYIHVMDLVEGHIAAMKKISETNGIKAWNLGTGKGYSVLEVVTTFEKVNNVPVPFQVVSRRVGDVGECYANPSLAKEELDWSARRDISCMVKDAWNWQISNPSGYNE